MNSPFERVLDIVKNLLTIIALVGLFYFGLRMQLAISEWADQMSQLTTPTPTIIEEPK